MAVPDFQTLMLPVLEAAAAEETMTPAEMRSRIAKALSMSADDVNERLPSGGQSVLQNRVAFALVHLQRALLMEKIKSGLYRITESGRKVLASNPGCIDIHFLKRYPDYVEGYASNAKSSSEESRSFLNQKPDNAQFITPHESIELAVNKLSNELKARLIDRLLQMSPEAFEGLIVDLLVAMGYGGGRAELAQQTRFTNDGGIDGMIKEDPLGLDLVVMQAKRYSPPSTVSRPDLQSFAGSLDGNKATKGIFVTTSTFTKGAIEFAQSIQKRLVLIDGEELARLMIRYDVGVRVTQTFAIKDIDENAFEEG